VICGSCIGCRAGEPQLLCCETFATCAGGDVADGQASGDVEASPPVATVALETVEPAGRPDDEGAGTGDGLVEGQNSGDMGPGARDDLADGQTSGDEQLGASDGLTDGQRTWDLEPATVWRAARHPATWDLELV